MYLMGKARQMRHEPAASEALLWLHLKNRKLGGYKFRRQRPVDRYITDFYCHEAKLVVELDGQSHEGNRGHDEIRSERMSQQGLHVIRFTNDDVILHLKLVLGAIEQECQRRTGCFRSPWYPSSFWRGPG